MRVRPSPRSVRPKRSANEARSCCRTDSVMRPNFVAKGIHDSRNAPEPVTGTRGTAGARRPVSGCRASEVAAERELEALLVMAVTRLRAERNRVADDQRPDRRLPLQRDTVRSTQFAGVETVVIAVHVADVGEKCHTCRVDVFQAGDGQEQLRRALHLECTADGPRVIICGRLLAGSEGVILEAAHITHTTGIVVLPEREADLLAGLEPAEGAAVGLIPVGVAVT